jgi:hypothetical protein
MQQYNVFITRRNITASPVTIIRRSYFFTGAFTAIEQAVDIHARHLATSPRTFYYRINVHEFTFKCVGDVMTNASCTIKDASQIFALFCDAREILGRFRIACFIHRLRAVIERYLTAVVPQVYVDLKTCSSTLRNFY